MIKAKEAVEKAVRIKIDKDDFWESTQEKAAIEIVNLLCDAGLTFYEAAGALEVSKLALQCCELKK